MVWQGGTKRLHGQPSFWTRLGALRRPSKSPNSATAKIFSRKLSSFPSERCFPLSGDRKLAINICLLWFCWLSIGIGYPLSTASYLDYEMYGNYTIPSVWCAWICAPVLDSRHPQIRTPRDLATATLTFRNRPLPVHGLSRFLIEAFFQNIMYGAYRPEVLPGPVRGTGTSVASSLSRLGGYCAPVTAANSRENPNAPVFIAR